MIFSDQTPPKTDPREIFFDLENDILSITEYMALIVNLTQFEMDDDERLGVHRLAMEVPGSRQCPSRGLPGSIQG